MSHLTGILNPDESAKELEILDIDNGMLDEHMSSSPEDEDDMTPASDEEIDELEDETDDDEDYGEPSQLSKKSGDIDSVEVPDESAVEEETKSSDMARVNSDKPKAEKQVRKPPRRRTERHDRRIDLGLLDHKAHPDCPDTLSCLPDTNGRPQHTLPVILRCAILGSPRKRLTIREIYATMETKYPYYKTAGQTWKQSVRHHLSLNRLFERQPRPVTDPGFGSYWTVNLMAPPGTKRPRKRGRQNKGEISNKLPPSGKGAHPEGVNPQSQVPQPTKFQFQPQSHPAPPPPPLPEPQVKSFSNPRAISHYTTTPVTTSPVVLSPPTGQDIHLPAKEHGHQGTLGVSRATRPFQKDRSHSKGRPHFRNGKSPHSSRLQCNPMSQPRSHLPYSHSEREGDRQRGFQQFRSMSPGTPPSGHGSAYPPSSRDSENDDNGIMTREDNKPPFATVSDDEYESEEDMSRPRETRPTTTTAFVPTRPSPIFSIPSFSGTDKTKDDIIEHMRQEIANLRRTSAEAVSTSLRLSEQLSNAHFEVARSHEVVNRLEDMLQDEVMKRRDAERQREVEAERRRAAEQALSNMAIRPPSTRIRPA